MRTRTMKRLWNDLAEMTVISIFAVAFGVCGIIIYTPYAIFVLLPELIFDGIEKLVRG